MCTRPNVLFKFYAVKDWELTYLALVINNTNFKNCSVQKIKLKFNIYYIKLSYNNKNIIYFVDDNIYNKTNNNNNI